MLLSLLGNGFTQSFALDRRNAKTCYMLGARGLSIVWGSDTDRWIWISHPDSRFSVASFCFFKSTSAMEMEMQPPFLLFCVKGIIILISNI